ncbi:hypothetical protein FRC02_008892 [Tulasnella sp. 418]|nr:hypothetical protein FRC02_008892 [Tulasnella sp. 418]
MPSSFTNTPLPTLQDRQQQLQTALDHCQPVLRAVCPNAHRRYRADAPPITGNQHQIREFSAIEKPVHAVFNEANHLNAERGLPLNWYRYVQPEGATYFYNPISRVVTPSNVVKQDILAFIQRSYDTLMELVKAKGRELPVTSETYLEAQCETELCECRYYFVSHSARVPFWAEDVSTEALGLEAVANPEHLKSMLLPEYWLHVEHFPMHNLLPLEAEEELIGVLAHGLVDDKTAPTSTTPYSAKEDKHFLEALRVMKKNMVTMQHDGYRLCTVARLWLMIARTRHVNAYGLQAPRLDRLQSIGSLEGQEISRILEYLSNTLLLGVPKATFKRLRSLWHGRIVYQRHWQALFEDIRREWIHSGVLALGIWIANVGLLYVTPARTVSRDLATISCGLSVTGVLLSSVLYKLHTEDQLSGAYAITEYLIRVESYDYGLQPLSVMLSLPYTFALWAIFTFSVALVVAMSQYLGSFSLTTFLVTMTCGGFPILFLFSATAFFSGQSGPIGVGAGGMRWIGRSIGNAVRQLVGRPINSNRF